jgi:hypothetical protein
MSEPYNSPFWDFSYGWEEEERKIPTKICLSKLLQWSRELPSDQSMPIYVKSFKIEVIFHLPKN